jgi:hypothetical protein
MRLVIAILTIIALTGTLAMAGEKVPDTNNGGFITSSRGSIDGSFDENSPTYERPYGGGLSLACANPMTDSSTSNNFFAMYCISASDSNPIEIAVDAALTELNDTTLTIYCDPFDFMNPLDNAVTYDDDGGDGLLSAFTIADNITLTPGAQYYLVLSNFGSGDPDDLGAFSIMLGDNLIECGTVANEELNWDSLKANYR